MNRLIARSTRAGARLGVAAAVLLATSSVAPAFGQAPTTPPSAATQATPPPAATPTPQAQRPQIPQVTSPEVAADGRITFRIYAPRAQAVRLSAGDIPGIGFGPTPLTKAENGVWEVTVGPVAPGAYRYNFNVDGVSTVDPRSSAISESNTNVSSLVVVPGSEWFDTKDVPHGAVAAVTYKSATLGRFRRMHIYTPPGYESGALKYPVFYLLHGAGDNDHAWSSVGRAGFILDNLIAAKRARPMIVVMPAGHTSQGGANPIGRATTDEFVNDFVKDVMPYVESHYRVLTDRPNTALAGLSMGGLHTLAVAVPRLGRFGYLGVYSSGLIGAFPELMGRGRGAAPTTPAAPAATARPPAALPPGLQTAAEWEKANAATIDDAALKKGLRLFWFATGKDDFLVETTRATVELLKKHGFPVVYNETSGGHTWVNWRDYLVEFAPKLFQSGQGVVK